MVPSVGGQSRLRDAGKQAGREEEEEAGRQAGRQRSIECLWQTSNLSGFPCGMSPVWEGLFAHSGEHDFLFRLVLAFKPHGRLEIWEC
ncbi:hypothetical protein MPTK1_2g24090 [Marchantia polymorpha subsp. ruderalis]|uniref:Uncharacterized protein n=1 Tax=Marchantia polymorpha TaxID=3197 RepID=A0A2R6WPF1_MARPO|nr:hypothetical protein MARPO_0069s0058 [Marchantia polymorpha]BBN03513.1 hypothetical protein Mp_2g24090 [Marchantia polymorpha subsp. ruderalis]|eukprot:PTQ35719.1 hypothetical protein MARPO_0069s0058 [Marchantia polymorpha]